MKTFLLYFPVMSHLAKALSFITEHLRNVLLAISVVLSSMSSRLAFCGQVCLKQQLFKCPG